jgi:hypothetical protein
MNGVAILGTGLACGDPARLDRAPWNDAIADGEIPVRHDPPADEFVPRNVRRRISRLIAMGLHATRDAGGLDAPDAAPLLFATANGEINTIGAILGALLSETPSVSPTAFHNSVHNAAPGYWSILAKRFAATTTISQGPMSFEMALLEAWARLATGDREVLACGGDEAIEAADWADPGHCTHDLCGALRLSADPSATARARLLAVRMLPRDREDLSVIAALAEEFDVASTHIGAPDFLGASSLEARHPMAGLLRLLRFVRAPGPAGRLMLVRTGLDGGVAIVASREAHD